MLPDLISTIGLCYQSSELGRFTSLRFPILSPLPQALMALKMYAATSKVSLIDLDIERLNALLDHGTLTSVELVNVGVLPFFLR